MRKVWLALSLVFLGNWPVYVVFVNKKKLQCLLGHNEIDIKNTIWRIHTEFELFKNFWLPSWILSAIIKNIADFCCPKLHDVVCKIKTKLHLFNDFRRRTCILMANLFIRLQKSLYLEKFVYILYSRKRHGENSRPAHKILSPLSPLPR